MSNLDREIAKRLKSVKKESKPLKKFDGVLGEKDTKLEPYKREHKNLRDILEELEDGEDI